LQWFEEEDRRGSLEPFAVDWLGGACLLVRAPIARQLGFLDEDFFMYCEETEWCHRFSKAGWRTVLVPSVQITHLGGQSSKMVPLATRKRMYLSSLRLHRMLRGRVTGTAAGLVLTGRFVLWFAKQFRHSLAPPWRTKRCP
jgi:GT2 family glycosyltransferase